MAHNTQNKSILYIFTTQINHFVTFILHFDFNKISNNTIKQLKI